MVTNLFGKVFGSRNDRVIKKLTKITKRINEREKTISQLTDEAIQNKTKEFKQQLTDGETLESLLPEAFAVVREASTRVLNMRHFDVQMIGGYVLNDGKIAEMKTGEGKTLVATLAVYLNALSGKGVHVVTVNDYLAQRDATWMSQLYSFLGLTTGVIVSGLSTEERKQAYGCDITYGTNNEFGFDYLRDNMAFSHDEKVQRELHFAVIDEVDSILIDEARTPLIISGPAEDSSALYQQINTLIPSLKPQQGEGDDITEVGDFTLDEKSKQVHFTEQGHERIEQLLIEANILARDASLYDAANISLMHHVNAALRAHVLFQKDVDYIVQDNQVVIVDEFTGRTMPGRRWSEGLHQAVEAKEKVEIQNENQTLASITFQNYFRLYNKLSGMTGTADTEAFELQSIYGLEVIVIPTHRPMARQDHADKIYLTTVEKYAAIVEDIKACLSRKQPVLVGTASIESSEYLHHLLKKEKIAHEVLNAKFHQKEAEIIAQAGRPSAVTIATNMAGRGTDIVLGGSLESELEQLNATEATEAHNTIKQAWQQRHDDVIASGGLHIIGSERHESRRVDNQLRGRSGRQGDAGSSRFYLSLEDNLMRIFASERMSSIMQKLGMEEGEAIEHPLVSRAIENAQKKVEGHNFDIRKQVLEFDDVANDQRKVIYEQRNELMAANEIADTIRSMRSHVLNEVISEYIVPETIDEQWDIDGLILRLKDSFAIELPIKSWLAEDDALYEATLREKIISAIQQQCDEKETMVGTEMMRHFEKAITLQTMDSQWKEHLAQMDYLRQGINLRSYAQKDPKQEYKREAYSMFTDTLARIKHEIISLISRINIQTEADVAEIEQRQPREMQLQDAEYQRQAEKASRSSDKQPVKTGKKVGRNAACPCGSGKKYKHCCGAIT